ncbi:MAG TPA: HD domain-containing phosphohydrolase, partial [Methylomirabilota bacterium]|nr:HD domain-containing phosphohydrolase [Methylomirabilota bacterium]
PLRFLAREARGVRHHHERFDGTGYPDGLRGEDIPLVARVVTVADVFDAITSDRPYRIALPLERARAKVEAGRAQHFDPQVVDAFTSIPLERLQEIAVHYEGIMATAGRPADEAPRTPTPVLVSTP